MAGLNDRLSKSLGDRTAKALNTTFGYTTTGDLLRHYPRRYVLRGELTDLNQLNEGDEVTILAKIHSATTRPIRGRKGSILEVIVTDGKGRLALTFFNQAWREKDLRVDREGLFAGKISVYRGVRQLSHPDYLLIPDGVESEEVAGEFAGKILPVYPATSKFPSWKIGQCIRTVLDVLDEMPEPLPDELRFGLPTLNDALHGIHLPESQSDADLARKRLIFDEALSLQLLLVRRREQHKSLKATPRLVRSGGLLELFDAQLPFELTGGQKEVAAQIQSDLDADHPMHRLLQGEVGSGKTIVALRAALTVVDSGGQAALLAPTEVLAQQHFRSISKLMGDLASAGMLGGSDRATRISKLTGSLSSAERKTALAEIRDGSAGIVIGTHSLLTEGVDFADLGLVIIDEQHRFGVEQRDALRAKGNLPPHVLVMTATPIPRTVAMTVFGDLDISTLRELPKGRAAITTHIVDESDKPHYLERAWARIIEEVKTGAQAYIVAPRISAQASEEISQEDLITNALLGVVTAEEKQSMYAVDALFEQLTSGPLKSVRIAKLHGQLTADEKDLTMQKFAAGEIDVLVATTVIEVGVDVANATVMVIMDADRFGISQLHQLRGRIGRGEKPGLCLLVTKCEPESVAHQRLDAISQTLDGFELARVDLDQRREGDVLGTAQSGSRSALRLLRVLRDEQLIDQARTIAIEIIAKDPKLEKLPELREELNALEADERSDFIEKA